MAAYQPMQNPVADLTDVFAMLSRARSASKDRDQRRAEMLMKQEGSDRDQARLDEQIRRQQAAEERQAGLDTAGAIPKIKNMLTPGHADYDPESGMSLARAYGINLNAQQPTLPTAPERPADKPVPQIGATPEAPDDGVDAVSGGPPQPEIRQNTEQAARFDQTMGDYQKQLSTAQRQAPTYHGTSRIGAIDIDPNAAVATREEQLRQQQQRLAPLTGAVDADFQPVVQAMVQAGMPGSEIAKAVADYRKQMATDNRDQQYKPNVAKQDEWHQMMYRAAMANAGARKQQAGDDDPNVGRAVSQYLQENPGDIPGAYATAGAAGSKAPVKTVGAVNTQVKPSESQEKAAEQAAQGLRAVSAIDKLGYKPNEQEIQQWLNNQRSVERADGMAKNSTFGALASSAGQGLGVLKRSEFDGMSPQAAEYFTNVRRMMEPLARKQSGAAIAESEWRNFFNQYGPMSPGGTEAARRDLTDLARGGGAATRQLDAGRRAPARKPSKDEERANTLKSGGKAKSLDELAKEHGL